MNIYINNIKHQGRKRKIVMNVIKYFKKIIKIISLNIKLNKILSNRKVDLFINNLRINKL